MRPGRCLLIGFASVFFVGAAILTARAIEEKTVELSSVPAAVQATVQQHLNGGKLVEIEMQTKDDGSTVYEVDIEVNGEENEFVVASDGKVLSAPSEADEEADEESEANEAKDEDDDDEDEDEEGEEADEAETEITLDKAPAAVRDAAKLLVAGNPVAKVTTETDDGVTVYEVEYTVADAEQSVVLTESGDVIETESAVAPADLPAAVRAALGKEFPGATIGDACAVETHFFEVDIVKDGVTREVKILASGAVDDDDEEQCDDDDEEEDADEQGDVDENGDDKEGEDDDDD